MNFKSVLLLAVISVIYVQGVTVEEEAKNSTTFTFDLYRSSFNGNVNTVLSPISFRILLSLIYQSASGDTERELKNQVYFSDDKHETAVSQRQTLSQLIDSPNVKIVNRLYVKKDSQLKQSFLAKALDYNSGIEQADFSKSQQTSDEINHFVEQQTNGLIKNLVSADNFNVNTALFLLNTLYFKADWKKQFDANKVFEDVFHGIDGQDYRIDYMASGRTFQYHDSQELKAHLVELPYQDGSNAKFWVLLPREDSNIGELKDKLNANVMDDLKLKLSPTSRRIILPSFEIESDINGKEELTKLGLYSLFEKSEISALEGSTLKVSDAQQKVRIIVNTKGTEAAAVTYVGIVQQSAQHFRNPPLIFDRPFIFMVLTADTTEPLFIGHFSKPKLI